MQQNPNASAWFANADGAKLSDQQLGWRVRAALRTLPAASAEHSLSTWRIVKTSVTAMSPEERRDSAWRYWSARAEVALGELTAASSARQSLARENSFYGLLTAEELGIAPTFNWDTRAPKQDDLDAFAAKSATQRALSFYQLDLRNEGLREWQFAIRGLSDAQLIAAAELARAAGLPDRAIGTSLRTQQVHDYSQRFPLPHRDALSARAREYQLDEAFVYGLIRQESRFIASSVSHAGAIGLMQLMPATAKWAAKQVGIKNYAVSKVREIDTNLALGSFYLRHVLDDLGHAVLAAAAYNAGPSRAKRWRAERPLDGVIYAESIPFNETRDYVKQVMLNKWFYLQRLGVKNVSLKSIMGVVPGKSASTVSVALMQPPNVALPVTGVER